MALKLLCLCLLSALLCPGWAKNHTCVTSASNCDECIQSGPDCAWCSALQSSIRCHTLQQLQTAGCRKRYLHNPQGRVQVLKNDSSMEPVNAQAVFLQPQELSLHLRPGVSQSFLLSVTMPSDQPHTELILDTSSAPAGVNITFSSILTGNPQSVQVTVEAARCPSDRDDSNQNRTGPWFVHITPRGFSPSVKLEITLECQCGCTRHRVENSPGCSGRGALVCGVCQCYESYFGKRCQEDISYFLSQNDGLCRSGLNAPVCSNRGQCVEDVCECDRRENPEERYSGRFCECSNFDCPYHNNRLCGGNGKCECGRCICDNDWTGEDCSCSMEAASCMGKNQMLCNGRGTCQCGACVCGAPYRGPTCEDCPVCEGR